MACVEREHEAFFRGVVSGHRLLPLMGSIFGWGVDARGGARKVEGAVGARTREGAKIAGADPAKNTAAEGSHDAFRP
jgi:hypothetical protein